MRKEANGRTKRGGRKKNKMANGWHRDSVAADAFWDSKDQCNQGKIKIIRVHNLERYSFLICGIFFFWNPMMMTIPKCFLRSRSFIAHVFRGW